MPPTDDDITTEFVCLFILRASKRLNDATELCQTYHIVSFIIVYVYMRSDRFSPKNDLVGKHFPCNNRTSQVYFPSSTI